MLGRGIPIRISQVRGLYISAERLINHTSYIEIDTRCILIYAGRSILRIIHNGDEQHIVQIDMMSELRTAQEKLAVVCKKSQDIHFHNHLSYAVSRSYLSIANTTT